MGSPPESASGKLGVDDATRRKLPKALMVGLACHRHVSFNCCAISSLLAFVTLAYSMVD